MSNVMKKNWPKVSIIVPIYNSGKYLSRCLSSLCGQLLKEIEIICINGGSTDDSLNILYDFAKRDNRIKIINQENSGAASARNKGLQLASASYIGFVDSDDFIAPDMYEKMYNAMHKNNVDFVECGAEAFFTYDLPFKEGIRNDLTTKKLFGILTDKDKFISTSDVLWKILFKKEYIDKYNLKFITGFSTYEDSLFVYSYKSLSQNGFYLSENLYMYFLYENSIMGKTFSKKQGQRILESLYLIEMYYSFLKTHDLFQNFKNAFWFFFIGKFDTFMTWAAPEIVQENLHVISNLCKNDDINEIIINKALNKNSTCLNKKELLLLSILSQQTDKKSHPISSLKILIRKILKYLLPYGIVRFIQKSKGSIP
jgi:glycosyltransferase involved in cell wall biosynthesis